MGIPKKEVVLCCNLIITYKLNKGKDHEKIFMVTYQIPPNIFYNETNCE